MHGRPIDYFAFQEYEAEQHRRNGDIPRSHPHVTGSTEYEFVDGKWRECGHTDRPSQSRYSGECDPANMEYDQCDDSDTENES